MQCLNSANSSITKTDTKCAPHYGFPSVLYVKLKSVTTPYGSSVHSNLRGQFQRSGTSQLLVLFLVRVKVHPKYDICDVVGYCKSLEALLIALLPVLQSGLMAHGGRHRYGS